MRTLNLSLLAGALLVMTVMQASSDPVTTTIVNPEGLYDPAPYGYSHAVVATNASGIVYIAGQGGENQAGELPTDFESQVNQAYSNLSRVLAATGAEPHQVTKITTYVVNYDPSVLGLMTKALMETFGDHLPTQTLVPVPRLALDGMLFEVDAIAVLNGDD